MAGRRFTVVVLSAFCGALLLGKYLFEPRNAAEPLQVAETAATPQATQVSYADDPTYKEIMARQHVIQELHAVEEGVESSNSQLKSVFSQNYLNGTQHLNPASKLSKIRWTPECMDLRNGRENVLKKTAARNVTGVRDPFSGKDRYLYPESYPGVDERYQINNRGGVKHDIILKNRPAGLETASYLALAGNMQLSPGMTIWSGEEEIKTGTATTGKLFIKDYQGHIAYEMPEPYMYDAKVTASDGSFDEAAMADGSGMGRMASCFYQVQLGEQGLVHLAIAAPTSWLRDPARVYPVTIDPNYNAGGLVDAFYIGNAGTGSLQGIHGVDIPYFYQGGTNFNFLLPTQLQLTFVQCGGITSGHVNVPIPFDFQYYGVTFPRGTILEVHEDGWATFIPTGCIGAAEFTNQPLPNGTVSAFTFYPYWDDLKFGPQDNSPSNVPSGAPDSGIYIKTSGPAGNRILVIEWYNMGFVNGGGNEHISFELVLNECQNKIQEYIGIAGLATPEVDRGECTVGIARNSAIGIQYDFDSKTSGPVNSSGQPTPLPLISIGTLVEFLPLTSALNGTPTYQIPTHMSSPVNITNGSTIPHTSNAAAPQAPCAPVKACFNITIQTAQIQCANLVINPNTDFIYRWNFFLCDPVFGNNLVAFSARPDFCTTFTIPGIYNARLEVTQVGIPGQIAFPLQFFWTVCENPKAVLTASPQGGALGANGLDVTFHTASISPPDPATLTPPVQLVNSFITYNTATDPKWRVDKLQEPNLNTFVSATAGVDYNTLPAPGSVALTANGITVGAQTSPDPVIRFLQSGMYRVTATWTGTNTLTELCGQTGSVIVTGFDCPGPQNVSPPPPSPGLPAIYQVSQCASIYIFVESQNAQIDENLVITSATYNGSWKGKFGTGLPTNPNTDTIAIYGQFSFPLTSTQLVTYNSFYANVYLNGDTANPIYSENFGPLRPNGTAKSPKNGTQSTFKWNIQTGAFTVVAKKLRLDTTLGIEDITENRLLPAHIRVELKALDTSVVPPVLTLLYPVGGSNTDGAIVSFDHHSVQDVAFSGNYQMGAYTSTNVPYSFTVDTNGISRPGGLVAVTIPPGFQEVLASGVFVITAAKFTVSKTGTVVADITGRLSRFGGDNLTPQDNSAVVVSLSAGNGPISETLHYNVDPIWNAQNSGGQTLITFNRGTGLPVGALAIKNISWFSRGGVFHIVTLPFNPAAIGLNLSAFSQMLTLGLTITPENGIVLNATTQVLLFKKSAKLFYH